MNIEKVRKYKNLKLEEKKGLETNVIVLSYYRCTCSMIFIRIPQTSTLQQICFAFSQADAFRSIGFSWNRKFYKGTVNVFSSDTLFMAV